MKLVFHYLKFDFLRWRLFLQALWVFVILHTAITGIAEYLNFDPLEDPDAGKVAHWSLALLRAVALGLAVLICHQIGKADSPVRGQTWLMTRPVHHLTMMIARGMFVFGGVVLPLVTGYALLLAMMKFNAATIGNEILHAVAFLGSVSVLVLLASVVSTSLSAFILGILTVGGAIFALNLLGLRPPRNWSRFHAHPAVTVMFLTLPALYGVLRMRRRLSRRQWALDGFKMGMASVVVLALPPQAAKLYKQFVPGKLERWVFADGDAEYVIRAATAELAKPIRFRDGLITIGVPLLSGSLPQGVNGCSAEITGVSWRSDPTAEWSEWREAEGKLYTGGGGDEALQGLSFKPEGFNSMQSGELRLKAWLTLQRAREQKLPHQSGAIVTGAGWVYELVERRNSDGETWFQTIYRESAAPEEGLGGRFVNYGPKLYSKTGDHYRMFRFSSFFLRAEHKNVSRPALTPGLEDISSALSVPSTRIEITRQRVIHITGLNIAVPDTPEEVALPKPRPVRPVKPPPVLRHEPFQEKITAYPWPLTKNFGTPIQ